jgi:uncharacterized membrane protein
MIIFGFYHFKYPGNMVEYVPANLPGGIIWVKIVGAAFIFAAVAFIFNRYARLAAYLLALLLIIFVFFVHLPAYLHGGMEETRQSALIHMLKDTALAAFALHIAGSADSKGIKF